MKRLLLTAAAVVSCPVVAGAADLLPLCTPVTPAGSTLSCLLASTFPKQNTFLCFDYGTDQACTSTKTAVDDDGFFAVDGQLYEGAPSGTEFVATKTLLLEPGQAVTVNSGNDGGLLPAIQRFLVPLGPAEPETFVPHPVVGAPPQVDPQPEPNKPPPTTGGGVVDGHPVATGVCGAIRSALPSVLYCEDFEDPALKTTQGWKAKYGLPFDGGVGPTNIAFVDGGGFLGTSSLKQQWFPGREGGTTGLIRFAEKPQGRITITQARYYSPNFKDRDHGVKDNRFEEDGGNFEIFGESSTGIGKGKGTMTTGNRFPFGAPLDIEPNSCIQFNNGVFGPPVCTVNTVANIGYAGENDVHYDLIPGAGYDFKADMRPGNWVCIQAAFDNWGKSNMTARYWVNGKKVIDVANIDGTKLRASLANGVTSYDFVAFYNNGYEGTAVAQRSDDNIVISNGAEPVSCQMIGF